MKNALKHALVTNLFVLAAMVVFACTPGEIKAAKTVLDVAGDACKAAFGAKPAELPPGVTLEDFCKAEENLQPFVDTILATQQAEAVKLGTLRTRVLKDAGAD